MSTQSPGGPRRRRIAGERRGRTLPGEAFPESPAGPAAGPSVDTSTRPVDLGKGEPSVVVPVEESASDDSAFALFDDTAEPTDDSRDLDADTDDSQARRTGWWGSRVSLVLLSALLVVLLALTGLAALGLLGTDGLSDLDRADATEQAARTAPAAAEAAAAAILAYDYKTLDADADTASRYMTEDFAKEYSDTFEKVVRSAAEANRAKVTASVLGSATIRSTENTARVVLFVDQTTVSKANPRPQVALNRVEMSMVREGDSWLVANISSY